jgi:hypothetical protein
LGCIGRDVNALLTLGFKLEIMADLIGGATIPLATRDHLVELFGAHSPRAYLRRYPHMARL